MDSVCVKDSVYALGGKVCGIANVERFSDAPEGYHPCDIYPDAKSVIVYGSDTSKTAFDLKTYVPYTFERNKLLALMDEITFRLAIDLQAAGYSAVPIPAVEPYEYWDAEARRGQGILSLVHAGMLAGLGFRARNNLLVNQKYGNRLWLGAVLTDAVLTPDPLTESGCPKSCSACLSACPQSALNGTTVDQKKCREIIFTTTEGGGFVFGCNQCRKTCPFSKV